MVKESAGVALMVKALAPALNTMALSSTSLDKVMEGLFEVAQVATSLGPLGTALGTQLVAVFQSPEVGLRFQVALPAKAPRVKAEWTIRRVTSLVFIIGRRQKGPEGMSGF